MLISYYLFSNRCGKIFRRYPTFFFLNSTRNALDFAVVVKVSVSYIYGYVKYKFVFVKITSDALYVVWVYVTIERTLGTCGWLCDQNCLYSIPTYIIILKYIFMKTIYY